MASRSTREGWEVLTIASPDGSTSASFVPQKGGTGSSLVLPGPGGPREMLFLHDFFWEGQAERIPGGWPFLFPVCGRLERNGEREVYLHDGCLHRLPSHGFGPKLPWAVAREGGDHVVLRLADTEATREAYPFHFEVQLHYRVEPGVLVCEQTYRNRGGTPLPYYAGFHPYFRTPAPGEGKESVTLDYRPVRAFRYNERLTDLAGERDLPRLPVSITGPDINERLTQVGADKETRLRLPDGLRIHMAAEGVEDPDLFPYVQLYTMPDKPFFCVEPWMAFPNALNTVKGVRWLEPGASEHGVLRLWTSG